MNGPESTASVESAAPLSSVASGTSDGSAGGGVLASCAALVVLGSAYAFGAIEPFWMLLCACLVLALGVLDGVRFAGPRRSIEPLPVRMRGALLLLAIVPFVGLIPLSSGVRDLLSPGSTDLLQAVLGKAAANTARPASLAPQATWDAGVLAMAASVLAVLGARAARDGRAGGVRFLLVVGGALLAAFGLLQRFVDYDPQTMYWSIPLAEVGTPFGPYVNRNHFAGAMELLAPCAAGVALHAGRAGKPGRAWVAWAATLLMVGALTATLSRGGVLGAGAALVVFVGLGGGLKRRRLWIGLVVGGLLVAGLLLVTGLADQFLTRFVTEPLRERWENRFLVQRDALAVFAGHPWIGTGAGTFEAAYPPFQSVDDVRHFGDAHSDWAQFLMELGLLGVAALALLVRAAWTPIRRALTAPGPRRWDVIAPLAGGAAIAVHGFVEVNLHVPSNSLLAVLVLSLAYGAALGADPARTVPEPNFRADDVPG